MARVVKHTMYNVNQAMLYTQAPPAQCFVTPPETGQIDHNARLTSVITVPIQSLTVNRMFPVTQVHMGRISQRPVTQATPQIIQMERWTAMKMASSQINRPVTRTCV